MPAKKAAKKTAPESVAPTAKNAPVAKKAPAKKAATKTSSKKAIPAASKVVPTPSPDAIARTAYLIYRERVEKGLPGDQHGDWLEAERRLGI